MPVTGRRELDEGYKPLTFEELAAVHRLLRLLEVAVLIDPALPAVNLVQQDIDRVRAALTRIKFITPEETSGLVVRCSRRFRNWSDGSKHEKVIHEVQCKSSD